VSRLIALSTQRSEMALCCKKSEKYLKILTTKWKPLKVVLENYFAKTSLQYDLGIIGSKINHGRSN
jgi:hypothetical protein